MLSICRFVVFIISVIILQMYDEMLADITEECARYGTVQKLVVPRGNHGEAGRMKVYILFHIATLLLCNFYNVLFFCHRFLLCIVLLRRRARCLRSCMAEPYDCEFLYVNQCVFKDLEELCIYCATVRGACGFGVVHA